MLCQTSVLFSLNFVRCHCELMLYGRFYLRRIYMRKSCSSVSHICISPSSSTSPLGSCRWNRDGMLWMTLSSHFTSPEYFDGRRVRWVHVLWIIKSCSWHLVNPGFSIGEPFLYIHPNRCKVLTCRSSGRHKAVSIASLSWHILTTRWSGLRTHTL